MITTTVAGSVVVDDTGERDQPRPRNVVDTMREDERKRNPGYRKPKKEVDEKRVVCERVQPRPTQKIPFCSPDDLGRVNPAATIKTENQKT